MLLTEDRRTIMLADFGLAAISAASPLVCKDSPMRDRPLTVRYAGCERRAGGCRVAGFSRALPCVMVFADDAAA